MERNKKKKKKINSYRCLSLLNGHSVDSYYFIISDIISRLLLSALLLISWILTGYYNGLYPQS